ncbi:MAG: hypothetical protein KDH96_04980 [Candidatus Riesia sp.]|nr:hypothetical protein [Candidatus Riesia sp.]
MLEIPLKLSINRPTGGQTEYIDLSIYDGVNGNQIIECQVSLVNFAKCVTGLSHVDADGKLWLHDNIGVEKFVKEVKIKISKQSFSYNREENTKLVTQIKDICALYEFDIRASDINNHHKTKYGTEYNVVLVTAIGYGDKEQDFSDMQEYFNNNIL